MNLYKLNTIASTLLVLAIVFFSSCSRLNNFRSAKLVYSFQFVQPDSNKLFTIADSLNLFYYDKYVVYELPEKFELSKAETDKAPEHLIAEGIRYAYFIYNKNKKQGYRFDSLTAIKPSRIAVDSFLNKTAFSTFPFYDADNDTLIQSAHTGNVLLEKHIYQNKKDESYSDTIYYYFDKRFKGIDYSFSPVLDSLRQSKLYKVRFIYNSIPATKLKAAIPERTFNFELKVNDGHNKIKIIGFVNEFVQREKTPQED